MKYSESPFYYNGINDERTKHRLQQLEALGYSEVAQAQFGIIGKSSGLYIEMIWRYTDEMFDNYIYDKIDCLQGKCEYNPKCEHICRFKV